MHICTTLLICIYLRHIFWQSLIFVFAALLCFLYFLFAGRGGNYCCGALAIDWLAAYGGGDMDVRHLLRDPPNIHCHVLVALEDPRVWIASPEDSKLGGVKAFPSQSLQVHTEAFCES